MWVESKSQAYGIFICCSPLGYVLHDRQELLSPVQYGHQYLNYSICCIVITLFTSEKYVDKLGPKAIGNDGLESATIL